MLVKDEPALARRESLFPEWRFGWEPLTMMNRMRETMDAMFNDLFRGVPAVEPTVPFPRVPAVDMYLKNDDLVVECVLPGLKKEDIEISITPDHLAIGGECKKKEELKKEGIYRSEISFGKFYRTLALPHAVKTDKVKAVFDNGILKITLPLLEPKLHKATTVKID